MSGQTLILAGPTASGKTAAALAIAAKWPAEIVSVDSALIYQGMDIGTPSVKSGLVNDLYLTLEGTVRPDDTQARIKIFVKPLIMWLWIGGALMAIGTVLAAFPGKRRRPTAPVSAGLEESVQEVVDHV